MNGMVQHVFNHQKIHFIHYHRHYAQIIFVTLLWTLSWLSSRSVAWMISPNHNQITIITSPSQSSERKFSLTSDGNIFSHRTGIILHDHCQSEKEQTTLPDDDQEDDATQLLKILRPSSKRDVTQISPTSLAYIGDVVFELYVRNRYVWPSRRTSQLQQLVVGKVRAEAQSILYKQLLESSFTLTSQEKNVLSRGRNAGSSSGGRKSRAPKRFTSKTNSSEKGKGGGGDGGGGSPAVYQEATALEALIGYAYLTSDERCFKILKFCGDQLDVMDEEDAAQ